MGTKFTTPNFPLLRFKVSLNYPYFSSVLFNLIPVEKVNDPRFETMAVDQHMRIYYNPEFLSKLTLDEAVGVVVHEVNHVLRDHLGRGKLSGDPYLWNLASDCEINDDIVRDVGCGVTLPADHIHPAQYKLPDNELAEWYFEELKKNKEAEKGRGRWGDTFIPGGGNCGSVATGQPGPGEDPFDGGDGSGKDNNGTSNPPGHSKEMVDLYRKAVAEDIMQRVSNVKTRGTIPGYLEHWAKKFLKHKVDWRKEVRAVVKASINETVAGLVDYSYRRPNRRQQPGSKYILPGFVQPVPKIAMITDTSGSMSDYYLEQAHAEAAGAIAAVKSDVVFVSCDADVHFIGNIRNPNQIQYKGRGGTDMRVAYEALRNYKKSKPSLVVCITDGETPWPEEALPKTKNLIVLLHQNPDATAESFDCPKWAKVVPVYCDPEEEKEANKKK